MDKSANNLFRSEEKMKQIIFIFLVISIVLSACQEKEAIFAPEEIKEGIDRCAVCNMLVPNDHNATQLLLHDGQSLKFDDIGCMMAWIEENGVEDVNVRYVRDYHTEEWIQLEEATFVYHSEFRTPMAYGVYSFLSMEEAEKFVLEHGKGIVLSYTDITGHEWERNMKLMEQIKEEMGHHH